MTVSLSETSCSLTVLCSNVSSSESRVGCDISVTDAQSSSVSAERMSTGHAQFSVEANMEYTVVTNYSAVRIVNTRSTGNYIV